MKKIIFYTILIIALFAIIFLVSRPKAELPPEYASFKADLTSDGWVPIIELTAPLFADYPEIASCGEGYDAVCEVVFAKEDLRKTLHLSSIENGWEVVGEEEWSVTN